MITCPQCQTNNPASARFCMSCGSFLPITANAAASTQLPASLQPATDNYTSASLPSSLQPAADTRPPGSLPASAAGFTLPSEAAQQTALPPDELARRGYLRYTRPTGQTGQLTATDTPDYAPPSAPPTSAPQSQAALWMTQSGDHSGYYYPPPPTVTSTSQQSSFGLYLSALAIALIVVGAAVWFLLVGLPSANGGTANTNSGKSNGGSVLAPTPAAPQGNNGGTTSGGPPKCVGAQAECDAVKATIDGSNQDEIASLKTLKTDMLKNHSTGPQLTNLISDVQALQSQGAYQDARLEHIDYVEIDITGATTATARTVETWSGTFYDLQTDSELGSQPAMTLHETYHFVKQNGQWLVNQVDIIAPPGQPGQPTPPDNSQLCRLPADCRL